MSAAERSGMSSGEQQPEPQIAIFRTIKTNAIQMRKEITLFINLVSIGSRKMWAKQ
jgi:hypothetical protein